MLCVCKEKQNSERALTICEFRNLSKGVHPGLGSQPVMPAGFKTFAQHKKARAKKGRRQQQRFSGPRPCLLPAMSSTPGGAPFKEQVIAPMPRLFSSIFTSSTAETVPSEEDITQLRKEVDDFIVVTRKQSARYQNHIDSLMARQGPETARRREVQKNNAAQHAAKAASKPEDGTAGPHSAPLPCQRAPGGSSILTRYLDSDSESDVPLRKKRKLDDTSRASTPRLSTPKGTYSFLSFTSPFPLAADCACGPIKVWRFADLGFLSAKEASFQASFSRSPRSSPSHPTISPSHLRTHRPRSSPSPAKTNSRSLLCRCGESRL
jgi:hypothetical protein